MKISAREFAERLGLLAAVVVSIYGVIAYIDSRIASAIDDPRMLRKISAAVRPEIIIDSKGAVLVDLGAMDYIERIAVTPSKETPQLAARVIITPKRYMAHAPLMTSIDAAFLSVDSQRTNTLDWVFTLSYNSWQMEGPNRLRIEILDR